MRNDDPLGRAMCELDDDELRALLGSLRLLSVGEETLLMRDTAHLRRFYFTLLAHLNAEAQRRSEVLTEVAVALAQDEQPGALVYDIDATIVEARRGLHDE